MIYLIDLKNPWRSDCFLKDFLAAFETLFSFVFIDIRTSSFNYIFFYVSLAFRFDTFLSEVNFF